MLQEHQLQGGLRRDTRAVIVIHQHEVSLHALDAKRISIREFHRIMLGTLNHDGTLSNTVVTKLHCEHRNTIAHTILVDELRIEIEHQAVALMEGRIHLDIEAGTIERLHRHEHHRCSEIPYISRIAGGREISKLSSLLGTTAHGCNLVVVTVSQVLIHILQQFGMTHIINHGRIKLGRGDIVLPEHRLAISQALPLVAVIIHVCHRQSQVIIIKNIRHLALRQDAARQGRLAG